MEASAEIQSSDSDSDDPARNHKTVVDHGARFATVRDLKQWAQHVEKVVREVGKQHQQTLDVMRNTKRQETSVEPDEFEVGMTERTERRQNAKREVSFAEPDEADYSLRESAASLQRKRCRSTTIDAKNCGSFACPAMPPSPLGHKRDRSGGRKLTFRDQLNQQGYSQTAQPDPTTESVQVAACRICSCGASFLDDALFCRKCGERRPNACICGNILKDDAVFCRRCGRPREAALQEAKDMSKLSSIELQDGLLLHCQSMEGDAIGSHSSLEATTSISSAHFKAFEEKENEIQEKNRRTAEAIRRTRESYRFKQTNAWERCYSKLLRKIVAHSYFDHACALLLISNTIFVGFQVNATATAPLASDGTVSLPIGYRVVDIMYTGGFLVELLLRLGSQGPYQFFIKGDEVMWNNFDFVIVASCVIDLTLDLLSLQDSNSVLSNLTVVRVIRILRITRVVRIVRVLRFFRKLRILISAILNTVATSIWTVLLLCMIVYVFAVLFTQGVSDRLQGGAEQGAETTNLRYYFGSLPRSMYTCMKAILGGIDWEIAAQALSDAGEFYVISFLFMIMILYLAVLNVISGLFLQTSLEQAQLEREDIVAQHEADASRHVKNFVKVFKEVDTDEDNRIYFDEFEEAIAQPNLISFLRAMDMDARDAWTLFRLLDSDGEGFVDMEEFVHGCMQLKGFAKSIHVAQLLYENRWSMDALNELAKYVSESFQILSSQLSRGNVTLAGRRSALSKSASVDRLVPGPELPSPSIDEPRPPPSVDPPLLPPPPPKLTGTPPGTPPGVRQTEGEGWSLLPSTIDESHS